MPRLAKTQISQLRKMISQGLSLNDICSLSGIKKTTVYYYMKNMLGKKTRPIQLDLSNLERIGEIIGVFAGDGYFRNDSARWDRRILINFNANESKVIEYYTASFSKLTSKRPGVIKSGPVKIVQVCSKDFCEFILSYLKFGKRKVRTVELRNKSFLKDRSFTIGFLRGLIDSDGYVRKGRREIYYGSISNKLFEDFITGLNLFEFKYKVYLQKSKYCDFHKVRLSGDEVDKFVKLVSPAKAL